MDKLLNQPEEYELIEARVGQADVGHAVACDKCGAVVVAAKQPVKRPACAHCYELMEQLKVAKARGFRMGL